MYVDYEAGRAVCQWIWLGSKPGDNTLLMLLC